MVSCAKENQTSSEKNSLTGQAQPSTGHPAGQIDKDVVCPKCFKLLQGQSVLQAIPDRYGRKLRKYFGWCLICNVGFEVIQFERDDRWIIHKYQLYRLAIQQLPCLVAQQLYHCLPIGKWTVLNELPEPAPVVVGPGGDFDKQITPEVTTILKSLQNILEKTSETLKTVLKLTEQKK